MKYSFRKKFLSFVMMGAMAIVPMLMAGCSVSQFDAYLNAIAPAITDILEIVAVFSNKPANTALPAKVAADVASLEKLESDYTAAATSAQPGIKGEINAAFAVLNSDIGSVEQLAQISDPATQQKVTLLLGLVETGVTLAEGLINPPATVSANAKVLNPGQLVTSFNSVLKAKTGVARVDTETAKLPGIHIHSKLVRILSLGAAH